MRERYPSLAHLIIKNTNQWAGSNPIILRMRLQNYLKTPMDTFSAAMDFTPTLLAFSTHSSSLHGDFRDMSDDEEDHSTADLRLVLGTFSEGERQKFREIALRMRDIF